MGVCPPSPTPFAGTSGVPPYGGTAELRFPPHSGKGAELRAQTACSLHVCIQYCTACNPARTLYAVCRQGGVAPHARQAIGRPPSTSRLVRTAHATGCVNRHAPRDGHPSQPAPRLGGRALPPRHRRLGQGGGVSQTPLGREAGGTGWPALRRPSPGGASGHLFASERGVTDLRPRPHPPPHPTPHCMDGKNRPTGAGPLHSPSFHACHPHVAIYLRPRRAHTARLARRVQQRRRAAAAARPTHLPSATPTLGAWGAYRRGGTHTHTPLAAWPPPPPRSWVAGGAGLHWWRGPGGGGLWRRNACPPLPPLSSPPSPTLASCPQVQERR